MNADPEKPRSDADAELEREIRADRKFTLSEAIGRMAGPGMMKGVSPVTRTQQTEAEIADFVNRHLADSGGVLRTVLLRALAQSDLLLGEYHQPLTVLLAFVKRILESEYRLSELVREADVEWGRVFGERPHFERPGCPPDPDDPYTIQSVRAALSRLVERIAF